MASELESLNAFSFLVFYSSVDKVLSKLWTEILLCQMVFTTFI